jgi:hypothetical protein
MIEGTMKVLHLSVLSEPADGACMLRVIDLHGNVAVPELKVVQWHMANVIRIGQIVSRPFGPVLGAQSLTGFCLSSPD